MPIGPARRARRRALAAPMALAAGCVALVIAATPAGAAKHRGFTVKVKGGSMTLAFSTPAWEKIGHGSSTAGTLTTPLAPATASATGAFTLPIRSGTLNSASGRGTVGARGGLMIETHLSVGPFESSSSASALSPVASIGPSSRLTFTSPNFTPSAVPLFTLATAHVRVLGSRHALTLNKIPANPTAAGAQFFGSSFKAGQRIATVTIQAKG